MDNAAIQPTSSVGSSETINEIDLKGSLGEGLDQHKGSLVKQKEAELKEMQDQIESYNHMVKQLTSQRELAIKKLTDMDAKIEELNKILETERIQIEAKEKELITKRSQLQTLKSEENELKEKFNLFKQELSATTENLSNTQLHEAQIKTKLTEMQQFLTLTNAAIDEIEKAISIKDTIKLSGLCNQVLTPPPLSINTLLTNGTKSTMASSPVPGGAFNQPSGNSNDSLFDSSAHFDPFADDDPFDGDDPFKSEDLNLTLPEDDPFNPTSASAAPSGLILAQNDPFAPPPTSRGGF